MPTTSIKPLSWRRFDDREVIENILKPFAFDGGTRSETSSDHVVDVKGRRVTEI